MAADSIEAATEEEMVAALPALPAAMEEEEEMVAALPALPASPDPPQASEDESSEVAAGTARGGRHLFYNKIIS